MALQMVRFPAIVKASQLTALGSARCFAWVISVVVFAGCAVDPGADYERAVSLIVERTGSGSAYSPVIEGVVSDRVTALLEDGLTVDEAVEVALLNNKSLQARFFEIGVSRADVVQSRLLSNPVLFFSARLPDRGGRANLSLSIAQELVDIWQIPVRKRIALAKLDKVVFEVVQAAVDLNARAKSACFDLLALHHKMEIMEDILAQAEEIRELARRQFEAGESNLLDANLANASVLDVRAQLRALLRDEQRQQTTLSRILGLSQSLEDWRIMGSLPEETPAPGAELDLVLMAMERRLDAQAAALEVKAAQEEVRKEFRSVIPSLSVGVDAERPDSRAIPSRAQQGFAAFRPGRDSMPAFPTQRERKLERNQIVDTLIGPSLEITLPVFDQNRAQIAKARYKAAQSRKQYEALLDAVSEDVRLSLATLHASRDLAMLIVNEVLPLAEQNVSVAGRAYVAGETSFLALMKAQETLQRQRIAYVDTLRDQAIAAVELERAVGGVSERVAPVGTMNAGADAPIQFEAPTGPDR